MSAKLWDRARDNWPAILRTIGISGDVLSGRHMPCPACGGVDRFRYVNDAEGSFFCGDQRGNGIDLVRHLFNVDFRGAAEMIETVIGKGPREHVKTADSYAEKLRPGACSVRRSHYLESRGLEIAPGLHWHRDVEYRDESGVVTGRYPAMLAPVTLHGKFLTYHVTYLARGAKAAVPIQRKILPGAALRGASVALYEPAETMGIAEGIETAIAAKMLHDMPVWSALNTALLKTWEPPTVAKHIRVFADRDRNYAGAAAAYVLANRLAKTHAVEVLFPTAMDIDFNDILRSAA